MTGKEKMGNNSGTDLKLPKEEWSHVFPFTHLKQYLKQMELNFFLFLFPSPRKYSFSWRRLLIRIKLSFPFSCHIPSCPTIQLSYSYTFKIPPFPANQSCEEPCCNFVLFTFSTYVTMGFWGAFCWLKLIRKNIYKVLASWAYISVVSYIMKPVWVGLLQLLFF